jgi:hypothetical protein
MSATRVHRDIFGVWLLESFDHRSVHAFDDFVTLLTHRLAVDIVRIASPPEAPEARLTFRGEQFVVAWSDERGCHVRGSASGAHTLRTMSRRITRGADT